MFNKRATKTTKNKRKYKVNKSEWKLEHKIKQISNYPSNHVCANVGGACMIAEVEERMAMDRLVIVSIWVKCAFSYKSDEWNQRKQQRNVSIATKPKISWMEQSPT